MIVEIGCLVRTSFLNDHFGKEAHKWLTPKETSIYVECAAADVNICVLSKWCKYKDTSILCMESKGHEICFLKFADILYDSSETTNSQTEH